MSTPYVAAPAKIVKELAVRYIWGNRAYAQRWYTGHVNKYVGKRVGLFWRKKLETFEDAKAYIKIDEMSQVNNMHRMTESRIKNLYFAALDNKRVCIPVSLWIELKKPHAL
jgi:hypothetical protein